MTLNSVELSKADLPEDGKIRLELPEDVIRRLDHGYLTMRLTVVPCPPEVGCAPFGNRISNIRIEEA